jgi:hypothetical protein
MKKIIIASSVLILLFAAAYFVVSNRTLISFLITPTQITRQVTISLPRGMVLIKRKSLIMIIKVIVLKF